MARKAMLIDLARCAGCCGCVVACQMQNNTRPGVVWGNVDAIEWGEYPDAGRSYLPHACMQCDAPACVAACPTGASYQRDDNVTLVEYDKCICCGQCVTACPYGARHLSQTSKYWFDSNTPAPYEAEGVQRVNVAEKCIFCAQLVDSGGQPACVTNCPGGARFFGDIDDPESSVAKKAATATRVDETGFYYLPVNGMDPGLITPFVTTGGQVVNPKTVTAKKAEGNATPIIVGASVIAAAAVGAGVGVTATKSANRKAAAEAAKTNTEGGGEQ
jgi:Fe-S-cluster-containing dehydrogenase component